MMKERSTLSARHRASTVRTAFLAAAVATLVACPPNAVLSSVEQQVNLVKASGQPVITPQISPASASYPDDQSVIISDSTPGATIQYTTDGSKPTSSSPVYTGPISVAGNGTHETIIAYANKSGMTDSTLATASYIINYNQVYTPVFSQPTGSYAPGVSVSISSSTGGASIRYTTDGSTPTSSTGTLYSGAVTVGQNETITAIAYEAGKDDSNTASATYTVYYYYVYVANNQSNNITALKIDSSTGALTAVSGSPFSAGTNPNGVAAHPTGKFLYVVNSGANSISTYSINAHTGAIAVVGSPIGTDSGPSHIAIDPTGKFLYVSNYFGASVSAYTINTTTGALTEMSGSPYTGIWLGAEGIAIDPTGKFLYVACFDVGYIAECTINSSTGALTINSWYASDGISSGATWVVVDPTGQYAYVPNYALSNMSSYSITPGTGELALISGSPFAGGTNNYSGVSVAEPSVSYVYTADYGGAAVYANSINPNNGQLSVVSGSPFVAGTQPAEIAVDATARFLYATNSGSANVSAYNINSATGALTPIGGSPFQAGSTPHGIVTVAIPGP